MAHKDLLNSVYVTWTFRINAVTLVVMMAMRILWRWRWLSYKNNDFAATADDDDDDDDDNDDENNDDDGLAMGVVKGARRPRLNAISACNIPNDASNYDSKLAYNLGLKHSCEP